MSNSSLEQDKDTFTDFSEGELTYTGISPFTIHVHPGHSFEKGYAAKVENYTDTFYITDVSDYSIEVIMYDQKEAYLAQQAETIH